MRIPSVSSSPLLPSSSAVPAEAPVSSADPVDRWKPEGAVATPPPRPNFAPAASIQSICARLHDQFDARLQGQERAVIALPVELGWRPTEEHDEVLDIADALMDAGGRPRLIHQNSGSLDEMMKGVTAVALPGGRDISPEKYGARLGPGMDPAEPDSAWDDFEIGLIQYCFEKGIPMLGHCRGYQLMNSAEVPESLRGDAQPVPGTQHVGGTMIQDIPSEFHSPEGWGSPAGTKIGHRPESVRHSYAARTQAVHMVVADESSRLAQIAGALQSVNSVHHQCLGAISPLLVPVAWALDGLVEGVERKGMPWQSGYQFHAEALRYTDKRYQALYDDLVDNAVKFGRGELQPTAP